MKYNDYTQINLSSQYECIKFKMESRQSCLHDFLATLGTKTVRKTTSFKKTQKVKKINISLHSTHKKTSTKKLALSKSLKRAEPNENLSVPTTGVPEPTHTQSPLLKPNKGLTFHPKKISFNNQSQPKVVSQRFFDTCQQQSTCPSLKIKPRKTSDVTSQRMTYGKRSSQSYYDDNLEQTRKVREKKNSSPQSPNSYIAKIEKIIQNTKRLTTDIELSSTSLGFEFHEDFFKKKTSSELNYQQIIEAKKETKYQSIVSSSQNQDSSANFSGELVQNGSFIHEGKRLGEGVNTIISHYDQSSKKSESLCYSNVIFKMNGENLRYDDDYLQFNEIYQRGSLNETGNKSQFCQEKEYIPRPSLNFKKQNEGKSFYMKSLEEDNQILNSEQNKITQKGKSLQIEDFEIQQIENENSEAISFYDTEHYPEVYKAFEKINYLGVGRFASVYLCRAKSTYFLFAMKEVLKFTVDINNLEEQINREISIQNSLNHTNILSLYQTISDKKKIYMLLEYGEDTLFKKLERQGAFREGQCLRCLWEIGQGIQYLHEKNICHRDIKPENIIIVNGICKIGDFGWCKYVQNEEVQLCGTPCYASPQIQNAQPYTIKTDCWSLGVLAYEIISGPLDQQYFDGVPLRHQNLNFPEATSTQYKQITRALLQTDETSRPTIKQIFHSFECFQQFFPESSC